MSRQFIVAVDGRTIGETDKARFTTALRDPENLPYWHWFPDLWILIDKEGKHSLESIRELGKKHMPNAHLLVLEANDFTWCGWGVLERFKWFHLFGTNPEK